MDATKQWEYFDVQALFAISGAKTIKEEKLNESGSGPYPHVSARATNNGVLGFYNQFTELGGALTIETACNGFCSYQKENFSGHGHLAVLRPKFAMNDRIALFFVTLFNFESKYYYFGRKRTITQIKSRNIKLPIIEGYDDKNHTYSNKGYYPDFDYMDMYIKNLLHEPTSPKAGIKIQFTWQEE